MPYGMASSANEWMKKVAKTINEVSPSTFEQEADSVEAAEHPWVGMTQRETTGIHRDYLVKTEKQYNRDRNWSKTVNEDPRSDPQQPEAIRVKMIGQTEKTLQYCIDSGLIPKTKLHFEGKKCPTMTSWEKLPYPEWLVIGTTATSGLNRIKVITENDMWCKKCNPVLDNGTQVILPSGALYKHKT